MTHVSIPGIPEEFTRPPAVTAATSLEGQARINRARDQFGRGRIPYNAQNQPRDLRGKYRKVLARLRFNLGEKQLQGIVAQIRKAEAADEVGDYKKSADAGQSVVQLIDKVKEGALDLKSNDTIREGARELGRVLAYLPLPQGDNSEKVRFSDLPPSTKKLIRDIVLRVESKLEPDKAAKADAIINSFQSGVRTMSADQILAELNKLLRYLT